jgi:bacteriorhodopsin
MGYGFEKRANDALTANPDVFLYPNTSQINITTHGSDWYWAVTAVMALSSIIFMGLSFKVPRQKRIFHYITAAITLVASIAYFTMASNLGYAAINVEFVRTNPKVAGLDGLNYREIFYVRYIDWFVTTPLLLLDLLLTCGMPWPTIIYTILMDEIMVVTGLVGALVASSYKWGYFVFAMVALFFIAWNVVFVGRSHAGAFSNPEISRVYLLCGVWTIFLWFLYPIAWGLAEGGNVISPDSEAIFYGILDILAKPVFGALLLWGHRNIDPATLGLHITDYADTERVIVEKDGHHPVHNAGGVGTHNSGVVGDNSASGTGVISTGTHNNATSAV